MNTRAITLIATIAVIGIVAVGAGYAYTALTINDGNNADAHYVTLAQSAYTFTATNYDENFDSITTSTNTSGAYKISVNSISVSDHTLMKIGEVTISATPHGYDTNADLPVTTSLTINSTSGFSSAGTLLTYYLLKNTGTNELPVYSIVGYYNDTSSAWMTGSTGSTPFALTIAKGATPDAAASYDSVKLALCYGYADASATVDYNDTIKDYVPEEPQDLEDGMIAFQIVMPNEPQA